MTRSRPTPADRVFTSRGVTAIMVMVGLIVMASSGVAPAAVVMSLLPAAALAVLNKVYNLTHSTSMLYVGLYMLMQAVMPAEIQTVAGLTFASVTLVATGIMFLCFHAPHHRRTIFMVFFTLGIGSLFSSAYWTLILVFILGVYNMRAFTLRGVVAALLGLLTPPLLLMGYGVMAPRLPMPDFRPVTPEAVIAAPDVFVSGLALTGCCVLAGSVCVLLTYGFQAESRNYNASIHILTLYAIVMFFLDFGHSHCYMPLLAVCAAYQTALFSTSRARGYIGGTVALIVCLALLIFNIWR